MIEVTFATAFILYLGFTLTIVLSIWAYSHYRGLQKPILSSEQELFICEYCHHTYLGDCIKTIHQCPRCGFFNKKSNSKT
jgi:hypothetical protein